MADRIILFLSPLNTPPAGEKEFVCPDAQTVRGVQSNEAPVKYLLRVHPEIRQLLCIVTRGARESAWAYFREQIEAVRPGLDIQDIPFHSGADFAAAVAPDILSRVEPEDSIYLETTGGFRDSIMHLLLLSRILSYAGIRTAGAVYGKLGTPGQIVDISDTVGLFELVGGMQELTRFGSTDTLQDYYRRRGGAAAFDRLLRASQRLTNSIALCRTREIAGRTEEFNRAFEEAEAGGDALMQKLLLVFEQKFGKRMTVPGIIKWCLDNGMAQQALTVYKECVPAYLFTRKDLLTLRPRAPKAESRKDWESEEEALFREQLLNMAARQGLGRWKRRAEGRWEQSDVLTLEFFEELIDSSPCFETRSPVKLQRIAADYLYLRLARNMINHADADTTQKEAEEYLSECGYPRLSDLNMKNLSAILSAALEHMR